MFGFLIKKSFWGLWDNMGRILGVNIMFTLLLLGFFATTYIAQISMILAIIVLLLLLVVVILFLGSAAAFIRGISDFKPLEFKEFFKQIRKTWKHSVSGGLFFSAILFLTVLGMRFYFLIGGMLGLLGGIFLFWIFITVLLSSLYYFPVMNRLETTFLKMIKKCFLIFLDNPFQTVGVLFGLIFNLAISLFTFLLIPGPAGALLWLDNNLRLLLYKYDFLEEHPEDRRKIPWGALLLEDKEKIGPRTLRNTIFPWK